LDLGIGKCRVVAAVDRDIMDREIKRDYKSDNERLLDDIKKKIYYSGSNLRIATKYVCITRDFFNKKGVSNVQIIKLYGNVELAPISGLCDFIVDLVSTGETLKQNNLMPLEDIVFVTSRLIVNRASLKINSEEIASLIDNLREQVKKNAGI
ncbi:MAG: ATP phosphoribosyltransferase, partial [Deltaproteobacteria bacterium]|nr:ATP phosphoribosyltransferase [Deltaproteobacteria bacterium]